MAPLTARARKALSLAPGRGDEAILLGLALEGGSVPAKLLKLHGVGPDELRSSMRAEPDIWNVLGAAEKVARRLKHAEVGTEHIMLALVEEESSTAAALLKRRGAEPAQLRAYLLELLGTS